MRHKPKLHRSHLYIVHCTLNIDDAGCRVRVNRHGCGEVIIIDAHRNREVQGHHAIAAVDGLEGLGVVTGGAVGFGVPGVAGVGTNDSNACLVAWA